MIPLPFFEEKNVLFWFAAVFCEWNQFVYSSPHTHYKIIIAAQNQIQLVYCLQKRRAVCRCSDEIS